MLLLVYRSCFCQYKKKQSIIKVWKCILKPHIYNIFSIRLLWKVIQHAKFPWIWRSLPINYRIVCTFFFSFILLCIFIPDKATLFRIKNNRRKNEPSRGRRKCLKCEGIKIKSSQSETTFKYCFYYFPNTSSNIHLLIQSSCPHLYLLLQLLSCCFVLFLPLEAYHEDRKSPSEPAERGRFSLKPLALNRQVIVQISKKKRKIKTQVSGNKIC